MEIGNQVWMSKNLNVDVRNSKCSERIDCEKYGSLYTWDAAKTACPSGWRLPKNADWDELINYVESKNGCLYCANRYLKTKSDWGEGGNGEDKYGFSALPGGYDFTVGGSGIAMVGEGGFWWSATEFNDSCGWHWSMYNTDISVRKDAGGAACKNILYSVRCIKGAE